MTEGVQVAVEVTAPQRSTSVVVVGESIEITRVDVTTPAPAVEVIDAYMTGPAGPVGAPGAPGPPGPAGSIDEDLPDMTLIFENGLI